MKDPHIEPVPSATAPVPVIKNRSWPSVVWLIPLITALIGGWLIIKTISEKGPQIEITFKTAEGIEAGKTKIKYKEIEIGTVDSVHFSKDFSHIILKAGMEKGSTPFLRQGTHFWVVKPHLSLRGGATGLNALLSGNYIEIEPGQGAFQKHFSGLDKPPVVKADVDGTKIMILAEKLNSIDTGSPIYYQGILAGEILGWELGNDRKSIFIHAFVKAPYNKLVKSNTRFWDISGIDVSIGSEGINLRTESLQALLYGGIAFETPDTLEQVKENVDGLVFNLHDNYQSIQEGSFTRKMTFILFFEGSVRGLSIGAPVEFKGIKIGTVKNVRLEFNGNDASFRIPVLIEIEPERVISWDEGDNSTLFQTLNLLVDRGLRARLQTGSLLTGQLYVDLDMHPDTPVRMVNAGVPYPELPTIPANLEQMTTSVKNILARMERLKIGKIGSELLKTLEGANQLINKPELADAVDDLQASLQLLKRVLHKLDQRVEPLTTNLETAIGAGHKALQKAQITLGMVDEVLKPGSPLQFRFIELTTELAEMARSIRTLVDMFERYPNAILFGKTISGEN